MDKHQYTNTLKEHRDKYGLLQLQVANLLGFQSTDRVSFWEQGKSMPGVINLLKLCVLFGVQPFDLYSDLNNFLISEIEEKKLEILVKPQTFHANSTNGSK